MKRELHKLCLEVIAVSLNPDQLSWIAQEIDKSFDLRKISGFGNSIAIPSIAAAETLVAFLKTDERIVVFLEQMFKLEGKFVYDTTVKIAFKNDLLSALARERWIFDPDTRTIVRDSFFAEKLNFLREIEAIDLRSDEQQNPHRLARIAKAIKDRADSLLEDQIAWQITLQLNRLSGEIPGLVEEIVSLLLGSQGLRSIQAPVARALQLLATDARNRTYRAVFEKQMNDAATRQTADLDELFEQELDQNGDIRLSEWAESDDASFDLHFKSSGESISAWTITHNSLSGAQKRRLLESVPTANTRHNPSIRFEFKEAYRLLEAYCDRQDPLRVVLYPDRTKIGFLLNRAALKEPIHVGARQTSLTYASNSFG